MEHRNRPTAYVQPTPAELRARARRNYAIAALALGFMAAVFIAMLSRGGVI